MVAQICVKTKNLELKLLRKTIWENFSEDIKICGTKVISLKNLFFDFSKLFQKFKFECVLENLSLRLSTMDPIYRK